LPRVFAKRSKGSACTEARSGRSASISRSEAGTRFVADYELMVFAKALGAAMENLVAPASGAE
jgi:hypothetical protein